ncbi:energy transducer TonB [Mangrovimicrobium sediminis]|uniref:Energy transducer TonB n=1 Tax=Mangrovimicrobium sediminis TaxID=2562682 RepID=A0A4Z0M8X9_9GAMM|nr:MotA/TolQ/ExbB proton channel family protein [Haliea sp. SAOS-164]TGD76163.1 energy transducer TonB [Haliea sp. SAOS-164]
MKAMIRTIALGVGLSLCLPLAALAEPEQGKPLTLESLLQSVKQGRREDQAVNRERLAEFKAEQRDREKLLAEIKAERAALEALSAERESQFEENELLIGDLEQRLQERMGSLKELFGVLQQVASDAQGQFYVSLTQLDHPERGDFLVDFAGRMGQANRLPEIGEIERLWFELQQEMTESGQVVTQTRNVLTPDGTEEPRPVTRVGLFNAVADGKYLQFIPETGRLLEYSRQPDRYLGGARALSAGDAGPLAFAVDPTRGQLLELLTQAPNLSERVAQGGTIGYSIIALGVAGLLLALGRLVVLWLEGRAIHRQMANPEEPSAKNALGRILLAGRLHDEPDTETLELRLSEAVLEEVPRINRYLPLLKIVAAVAPLMGLLGTVTGMIVTFQAITLFGAGDPRLMAGGISQALVTTVLGLCVAIPMLLLHNLVQSRAKSLSEILQGRAVAMVASRAEAQG